MTLVPKLIAELNNMKYTKEIVLMKMEHLRDIFVNLYQIEINLLYIFYLIVFIKNNYSKSFLNKN